MLVKTVDISVNITNARHANDLVLVTGERCSLHRITEQYEYSAGCFQDGKRNNQSAYGVTALIFDFDEGTTWEQGKELFSEYQALCVTTKSHQVDKKGDGVISDRFRIIVFLEVCIINIDYYAKLMRVLTRHYKSDIACTDPARYFSPNPNQLVHYTNGSKHFDITKFDEMIIASEENVHTHISHPQKEGHKTFSSTASQRIDLSSLLDVRVDYYHFGMKRSDTLQNFINTTAVSKKATSCHCFLNPQHEDRNPSCFIYRNQDSVYVKCVSCGFDGIIYIRNSI